MPPEEPLTGDQRRDAARQDGEQDDDDGDTERGGPGHGRSPGAGAVRYRAASKGSRAASAARRGAMIASRSAATGPQADAHQAHHRPHRRPRGVGGLARPAAYAALGARSIPPRRRALRARALFQFPPEGERFKALPGERGLGLPSGLSPAGGDEREGGGWGGVRATLPESATPPFPAPPARLTARTLFQFPPEGERGEGTGASRRAPTGEGNHKGCPYRDDPRRRRAPGERSKVRFGLV